MTHTNAGIPLKVLHKAQQLGIHNDCLSAGAEGACPPCTATIMTAFDFYYGELSTPQEVLLAIVDDYLEDQV